MHPLQAAKKMAKEVEQVLTLYDSNDPRSGNALVRAIDRLEAALDDFDYAVGMDRIRRADDPRICIWPKCKAAAIGRA